MAIINKTKIDRYFEDRLREKEVGGHGWTILITELVKKIYDEKFKNINTPWETFTREIQHKNRFLPQKKFLIELAEKIGSTPHYLNRKKKIFRARIYKDDLDLLNIMQNQIIDYDNPQKSLSIMSDKIKSRIWGYNAKDSGAPSPEKVSSGRINPKGIPYFYAAENRETAVIAIRPLDMGQPDELAFTALEPVRVNANAF